MADDERDLDGDGPDDLGEPIAELRDFQAEPPSGFVHRLLNTLRRRDLSKQFVSMGWTGFAAVLLEFVKMIFSVFEPSPQDDGGAD